MPAKRLVRCQRISALGGLAIAGTLFGLALVEGMFRVYYFLRPSNARGFFWEPHPPYGWRHPPKREGLWYDDHGEFRAHVRINAHGLRDVDHTYEKNSGVFRILVLGDSYMEALQVDLNETFARLLEQELNRSSHQRIEVINSGVASYGTDNELLYFRNEGHRYNPDLVLLAFTTANDVRENYEPFNRKAPSANLLKPYFTLNSNGQLVMHPGEAPPPPPPWWRRLHVGKYLYERLGGQIALPGRRGVPPPPEKPVAWDMLVYAREYSPEVQMAWQVTKALLRQLRDEVHAHGAQFAVVVVNGPWAHYDEDWRRMMGRYPLGMRTWDRQKPNRILGAFLWQEHIPSVDLYHAFEAAKGGERLFFRFDPHWTPAGHKLAAQVVSGFLVRSKLVPQSGATL